MSCQMLQKQLYMSPHTSALVYTYLTTKVQLTHPTQII